METNNKSKYEIYRDWCRSRELPCFVPPSGKCFACRRDVFEDTEHTAGYPETGEFITGCPHCHRTFCD